MPLAKRKKTVEQELADERIHRTLDERIRTMHEDGRLPRKLAYYRQLASRLHRGLS